MECQSLSQDPVNDESTPITTSILLQQFANFDKNNSTPELDEFRKFSQWNTQFSNLAAYSKWEKWVSTKSEGKIKIVQCLHETFES